MSSDPVRDLVVTAPWCHHCKAMQPDLDRLIAIHSPAVKIEEIDASLDPQRVEELGVRGTPTIILRKDGVESVAGGRAGFGDRPRADLHRSRVQAGSHRRHRSQG
jgi:thioredoxin-like negative regulator of GroEL